MTKGYHTGRRDDNINTPTPSNIVSREDFWGHQSQLRRSPLKNFGSLVPQVTKGKKSHKSVPRKERWDEDSNPDTRVENADNTRRKKIQLAQKVTSNFPTTSEPPPKTLDITSLSVTPKNGAETLILFRKAKVLDDEPCKTKKIH